MIARAVVAIVLVLAARTAGADTERHAVVIGSNLGAADERRLRFAEADAVRVSELLGELGGVRAENQVLLRGKSADQVRRALISTNERIRVAQRADRDAMLFVYYSGHGDADALHLGDGRFELRELEALVRGSPAQIRILVIDACRSGSLTRVKGGTEAPPISLSSVDEISGEGVIVLTASTAGEDAQESDQLAGSFFTHYLLTGLRGAADDDGDQIVTVAEAFRYTREHTVLASSRTLSGTQHPTFHFDLRGRADVVIADLGRNKERGQLALPEGATWLVLRGDGANVIGEVVAGTRRRTLSLSPGRYVVRGRTRDALLEGAITVAAGALTTVDPKQLDRISYARLARKSGGPHHDANRLFTGLRAHIPSINDALGGLGALIGWTHTRSDFALSTRLTGHERVTRSGVFDHVTGMVGLELRVAKVWDLVPRSQAGLAGRRSSIDLGLTGGFEVLEYKNEVDEHIQWSSGWHVDLGFGLTWPLGERLFLSAELAATRYRFSWAPGSDPNDARFALRSQLAVGTSL